MNGVLGFGISSGDYLFEVAVIPAELPQSRANATYHTTTTVTIQ